MLAKRREVGRLFQNKAQKLGGGGLVVRGGPPSKGRKLVTEEAEVAFQKGLVEPLLCHRVPGISRIAQGGDEVFDLFPVIEAQAAKDDVGDPFREELLLDRPRLGVGAVENGGVPGVLRRELGYCFRLFFGSRSFNDADENAFGILGPKALRLLEGVVAHHGRGGADDVRRRAVILFEEHDARVREVAFEVQEIAEIRAAERVDGLVVVPHHADVPVVFGKQTNEGVLRGVDVLVFVHEHVSEAFFVARAHVRMFEKKTDRLLDKVVEVEGVLRAEPLLVGEKEREKFGIDLRFVRVPAEECRAPACRQTGGEALVLEGSELPTERRRSQFFGERRGMVLDELLHHL